MLAPGVERVVDGEAMGQPFLIGGVQVVEALGDGPQSRRLGRAVAVGGVRPLFIGADLSPALLAVGYIVRLEVALQIFLGGALGWLVILPLAPEVVSAFASESVDLVRAASSDFDGTASERAWTLWSQGVRYVGVGAMAVGGLSALVRVRVGLMRALVELRRGWSSQTEAGAARLDLSSGQIGLFTGIAIVIVGAPANGSAVAKVDGTVDYTHDGSETSSDSFTYTINSKEYYLNRFFINTFYIFNEVKWI